uniref:Superoxide dismutase copper/zinc binding domain-containing protein n=1 Tax=Tetranychus urticae TaxID=32264 RepID=T1K3Q8_TETUR
MAALTTLQFTLIWITVATLTDYYGSASFWPTGFYSNNRDTSPTSSDNSPRVTGIKSVLDRSTWVTSTATINPPYAPPAPSQIPVSPSIGSPSTSVSSPSSYSPPSRYNPPPSSTSYSGNSYPASDWRSYNQYPTRNTYDSNFPSDPLNNQQYTNAMVIDCKYASIYRPSSYGSYSGSSSASVPPLPLLPPPPPPQHSSGSTVTRPSPYPYDGPRYSGYPCFIPPMISSDYSTYPAPYQSLPSASDASPIWSPPPPFPNYQPVQSSQIYPIINPMDSDPSRKSWPDSPYSEQSSQDPSLAQQSASPILKSTRAVAELSGPSGVTGTITFKQIGNKPVSIEGKIMGLASGPHGMHIYEMPFIGGDCVSAGDHYNPQKTEHGGKHDWNRHIGDLGNIHADSDGVANFEFTDLMISLTGGYSIVNRTIGISEKADDLGRGNDLQSKKDGNAGSPIACGIVHLSPV